MVNTNNENGAKIEAIFDGYDVNFEVSFPSFEKDEFRSEADYYEYEENNDILVSFSPILNNTVTSYNKRYENYPRFQISKEKNDDILLATIACMLKTFEGYFKYFGYNNDCLIRLLNFQFKFPFENYLKSVPDEFLDGIRNTLLQEFFKYNYPNLFEFFEAVRFPFEFRSSLANCYLYDNYRTHYNGTNDREARSILLEMKIDLAYLELSDILSGGRREEIIADKVLRLGRFNAVKSMPDTFKVSFFDDILDSEYGALTFYEIDIHNAFSLFESVNYENWQCLPILTETIKESLTNRKTECKYLHFNEDTLSKLLAISLFMTDDLTYEFDDEPSGLKILKIGIDDSLLIKRGINGGDINSNATEISNPENFSSSDELGDKNLAFKRRAFQTMEANFDGDQVNIFRVNPESKN